MRRRPPLDGAQRHAFGDADLLAGAHAAPEVLVGARLLQHRPFQESIPVRVAGRVGRAGGLPAAGDHRARSTRGSSQSSNWRFSTFTQTNYEPRSERPADDDTVAVLPLVIPSVDLPLRVQASRRPRPGPGSPSPARARRTTTQVGSSRRVSRPRAAGVEAGGTERRSPTGATPKDWACSRSSGSCPPRSSCHWSPQAASPTAPASPPSSRRARLPQIGTAFLRTPEAGTNPAHRAALASGKVTALTRAFTGRLARGLVNRFLLEHSEAAHSAYPHLYHATAPRPRSCRRRGSSAAAARQGPAGRKRTLRLDAS